MPIRCRAAGASPRRRAGPASCRRACAPAATTLVEQRRSSPSRSRSGCPCRRRRPALLLLTARRRCPGMFSRRLRIVGHDRLRRAALVIGLQLDEDDADRVDRRRRRGRRRWRRRPCRCPCTPRAPSTRRSASITRSRFSIADRLPRARTMTSEVGVRLDEELDALVEHAEGDRRRRPAIRRARAARRTDGAPRP